MFSFLQIKKEEGKNNKIQPKVTTPTNAPTTSDDKKTDGQPKQLSCYEKALLEQQEKDKEEEKKTKESNQKLNSSKVKKLTKREQALNKTKQILKNKNFELEQKIKELEKKLLLNEKNDSSKNEKPEEANQRLDQKSTIETLQKEIERVENENNLLKKQLKENNEKNKKPPLSNDEYLGLQEKVNQLDELKKIFTENQQAIVNFKKIIDEHIKDKTSLSEEKVSLQTQVKQLTSEHMTIEEVKQQLLQEKNRVVELEKKLTEELENNKKITGEISSLKEQQQSRNVSIKFLELKKSSLNDEIAQLKKTLAEQTNQINALSKEKENLVSTKNNLLTKIDQITQCSIPLEKLFQEQTKEEQIKGKQTKVVFGPFGTVICAINEKDWQLPPEQNQLKLPTDEKLIEQGKQINWFKMRLSEFRAKQIIIINTANQGLNFNPKKDNKIVNYLCKELNSETFSCSVAEDKQHMTVEQLKFTDKNGVLALLEIIYKAAEQHSQQGLQSKIAINFFDHDDNIIQELYDFFKKYPALIANNISVFFWNKEKNCRIILGYGNRVKSQDWLVKEIEELLKVTKNDNEDLINLIKILSNIPIVENFIKSDYSRKNQKLYPVRLSDEINEIKNGNFENLSFSKAISLFAKGGTFDPQRTIDRVKIIAKNPKKISNIWGYNKNSERPDLLYDEVFNVKKNEPSTVNFYHAPL